MTELVKNPQSATVPALVVSIEPLTAGVSKVLLAPQEPVGYQAGQYLQVFLSDSDKRPFSIASAPDADLIELQIGGNVTDAFASQALAHLREHHDAGKAVLVQVGLGDAFLRQDSSRPVILLAGGTGFSYVYSIAQQLRAAQPERSVQLFWGLRDESGLYYQDLLAGWQSDSFHVVTVLQDPKQAWAGPTGLVHEAVLAHVNTTGASLADFDIYIAGPFPMVGAVRDAFLAAGAVRAHMYADAFAWLK